MILWSLVYGGIGGWFVCWFRFVMRGDMVMVCCLICIVVVMIVILFVGCVGYVVKLVGVNVLVGLEMYVV